MQPRALQRAPTTAEPICRTRKASCGNDSKAARVIIRKWQIKEQKSAHAHAHEARPGSTAAKVVALNTCPRARDAPEMAINFPIHRNRRFCGRHLEVVATNTPFSIGSWSQHLRFLWILAPQRKQIHINRRFCDHNFQSVVTKQQVYMDLPKAARALEASVSNKHRQPNRKKSAERNLREETARPFDIARHGFCGSLPQGFDKPGAGNRKRQIGRFPRQLFQQMI